MHCLIFNNMLKGWLCPSGFVPFNKDMTISIYYLLKDTNDAFFTFSRFFIVWTFELCQRFWSTRRTKHLSTSHLSLLPRLDSCKDIWEDSGRFSAMFVTQKSIQNAFTSSYVRHAVITTTQSLCISQRRTQKMSDHMVQFFFHYKALFIWRAVGPGHPPTRANFTVRLYEKKKTWTGLW